MEKENIYYVYFYLREDNSPYYVGRGKKRRAYAKHINKEGVDFKPKSVSKIKIIHSNLTKLESMELEKKYIAEYRRKEFGGILINIKRGGEDLKEWTPEMRKKMSIARKGIKPKAESIEKMVKTRKRLGNYYPSKETRQKMSEALKGKFTGCKNPSARSIHAYSKDDIFINTFSTGREAAKVLSLGDSWKHIPECCNGKRKHVKGYKFKYTN